MMKSILRYSPGKFQRTRIKNSYLAEWRITYRASNVNAISLFLKAFLIKRQVAKFIILSAPFWNEPF